MRAEVRREYEALASRYDQRWSSYVRRSTQATLQRFPDAPTPGMRLLDVGCGTGALLETVLERFPTAKATGVDPSPAMLRVARRRLPAHVQLVEGWCEQLPFRDAMFDLVISCNVFHYLEQPAPALAQMKRVLKPGGRLLITDWCDDFVSCKVCGLALRAMRRPYRKIYGTRQLTRLLSDAAFTIHDVDRYKINWLWGLMTARTSGQAPVSSRLTPPR